MSLAQWLKHLAFWWESFPRWSADTHTLSGHAGGNEYTCPVCSYVEGHGDTEANC